MKLSRLLATLAGVATLVTGASVQAGSDQCPTEMQVYKFTPTGKRLSPDFRPSGKADMYIKIDGIDGESTDDDFDDWISKFDLKPVTGGDGGMFLKIDGIEGESTSARFKEPPRLYEGVMSCRK